jgi:hypothetical protein
MFNISLGLNGKLPVIGGGRLRARQTSRPWHIRGYCGNEANHQSEENSESFYHLFKISLGTV